MSMPADPNFVQRQGSVLTLAGKPFRFHGNNVYFNQADIAYGRAAAVEETLDKMAALGMTVARFNAHNDNDPSCDPAAIQWQPGVYSEAGLVALDRSIAMAKARGIRLICKLTNNWDAYGGIRRYVAWHLRRAPVSAEWGLFYTEPAIKNWFRNYAQMLIERRNTVTGVTYRDEPAILAWELGNELRNPGPGGAGALVAWTAEMAAFLKQLDARHLVADGGEGFDDAPSLYPGLTGRAAVSGADGASYHRLALIPELDMLSYHLYPASWGMNDGADAEIYIRRHEEIARQAGKVAYLGEFGHRANGRRAAIYQSWIRAAAIHQASAGVMIWQLVNDGKEDAEDFQVYYPQEVPTCAILRQASDDIANAPVLACAASFRASTVAPASIATLFGVDLANTAITIVDAAGKSHDAAQLYNSPGQINLLIPDALPPGAALLRVVRDGAIRASAPMNVAPVAPGLFASGSAILIAPDGTQTVQPIAEDGLVPIVFPAGGKVALSLYGTGIRGLAAPSAITAKAGGWEAEVLFAGPQSQFPGLDQVNLLLPPAVAGAGEIEIEITVAGIPANRVRVLVF